MTDQLDRLTTSLANRYRIERELGAGGMATVYLAEDLKHKRKVAIKVLRPELAATLGPERFVREIEIPRYVEAASASQPPAEKPELFGSVDDETLLGFGVPVEWLADVRQATEDTLFDVAEYLPGEAAEALLELATGGTPVPSVLASTEADPFAHPDAQRRFRLVEDSEELERALAYPWEKWTVFLHPVQRATVERSYKGPARVAGSAGTGKTVVALHRAVHLARAHPQSRVLLTTFSDTLAGALQVKLE